MVHNFFLLFNSNTVKRQLTKSSEHVFKIGESVFLLQGGKIRKLKDQYKGPYAVINNYKNGNVKLKTAKNKFSVVNRNRL